MNESVIITSHQRDLIVLVSAEESRRLIGTSISICPEVEQLMELRLEKHCNTIIELANR